MRRRMISQRVPSVSSNREFIAESYARLLQAFREFDSEDQWSVIALSDAAENLELHLGALQDSIRRYI